MKRVIFLAGAVLLTGANSFAVMPDSGAGNAPKLTFEAHKALVLKAVDERASILSRERECGQAAQGAAALHSCQLAANVARRAMGEHLRDELEKRKSLR